MDLSKGLSIVTLLAGSALAQKLPAPTGSVTGQVTCADTQLPARFATVSLVRKPSAAEIDKMFSGDGGLAQIGSQARKPGAPVDLISDTTDLNGAYAIRQVPPGDYWVVAKLKGYMIPVADATDAKQEADLDLRMAGVPLVHVAVERTSTADVSLRKGGVVAGKIQFEDGSPGTDVSVWLVQINKRNMEDEVPWGSYGALDRATDSLLRNGKTDDDGRYRMAGLPPGKYLVKIYLKTKEADRVLADGSNGAMDSNAIPRW